MYIVRCFSFFLATLFVAIFVQSDLQYISQSKAYKGALITALMSLLIGWLTFQGSQIKIDRSQVSIIKDVRDIQEKADLDL